MRAPWTSELVAVRPILIPVSGLALAAAFAPLSWTPIAWFAFVPLLSGLVCCRWALREALRFGLLFGLAFHGALLSWIFFLHANSENARLELLLPGVVGLATWFACPWAVLCVAVVLLRRRLGAVALLLVPCAVPWFEWLQSLGSRAFPWCSLAATQVEFAPVLQLGSIVGSLGITACLLLFNVGVTWWMHGIRRRATTGILVALSLCIGVWGTRRAQQLTHAWDEATQVQSTPRIALVQPDVRQGIKWHADLQRYSLERLAQATRLSVRRGVDVVIWPETAVPADLVEDAQLREEIENLVPEVHLVVGFPHRESEAQNAARNSVALFANADLQARYDKYNLLPLGERVPAVLHSSPRTSAGEFGRGDPDVLLSVELQDETEVRLGVLICFEVAFSGRARRHRKNGATLLVNPVNDGWFGGSAGPYQHAALARLRATETGLPLLRCANNGISYACGPSGELRGVAGLAERGIVWARIPPPLPMTPYARWGDTPVLVLCVFGIIMLVVAGFGTRLRHAVRERADAQQSP